MIEGMFVVVEVGASQVVHVDSQVDLLVAWAVGCVDRATEVKDAWVALRLHEAEFF